MQPDINLQLKVAIKALQDVVAPAIDPNNKPATEQLHLSIKLLQASKALLPYRHRFIRANIESLMSIAEATIKLISPSARTASSPLERALAATEKQFNDVKVDTEELAITSSILSNAITQAIHDVKGSAIYPVLQKLIVQLSKDQIYISRLWCYDSGVDTEVSFSQLTELV